ncbi:hydroxydechloroatrazine ethylaminohydrolase [Gluconobacter thailandicus F149-1 = NBRC 100600]|uniref:Amidohydrolase n=1 Tax=Gluconobacter thailandicus NBRC 3257 TaxID=1381097 RepID=A0ABQ0J035_GLUTH|nr:amidohydrolase family protein [Gluconobacter thailandicus]KXV53685.1 amidohydrolase [Gluconobacter thailandicus]GAC88575.1 amidohydrolase [Gluconobacter thailandicus NBRC 3255]GAD27810.1 amidohydrolase [Gluconobacter thailandicus NBRC 3257]GAN94189.1 hydroxydechloroatrazine ethylaminohydrolase [Gluconobacter thailandicus F149-1 = NBRC 100600]GBR57215.1 amidohydrolase [Gluconobacter thailandicus F149-1 = NBRC 100600]
MTLLIHNTCGILTGQKGDAARRTGSLRIRDGKIVEIGDLSPHDGETVLDAKGGVVSPGLISTHHHLFQSVLKAVPTAINKPLEPWLRLVPNTYWSRIDERALNVAVRIGMVELLLSGCTTVADHHYLFADMYAYDPAAVLFEAAEDLGLRYVLARGGTTRARKFDTDEIIPAPTETLDVMLKRVDALVSRYHQSGPNAKRRIVLAPNTPTWGVTPDELRQMAMAARSMGISLHSHLSETENYVRFCLETYNMRPVQFVAEHGWVGDDVWFAHLVHLDDSELRLLAQTSTGMAHCPQSNCRLGSGIAPAPALDALGGRVSLAVDGAASNEACDMSAEMHCAWMVHRAVQGAGAVTAEDVMRWSTSEGAAILDLPDVGRIEIGATADLVIHGLDAPRCAGMHDPLIAPVVSGATTVRHVLMDGKPVVVDGMIPGLDLEALLAEARSVVGCLAIS